MLHEHLDAKKAAAGSKGRLVNEKISLELKMASRVQSSLDAYFWCQEKEEKQSDFITCTDDETVDVASIPARKQK
eukprot:3254542-Ditylum_brightwellii.AAC.1